MTVLWFVGDRPRRAMAQRLPIRGDPEHPASPVPADTHEHADPRASTIGRAICDAVGALTSGHADLPGRPASGRQPQARQPPGRQLRTPTSRTPTSGLPASDLRQPRGRRPRVRRPRDRQPPGRRPRGRRPPVRRPRARRPPGRRPRGAPTLGGADLRARQPPGRQPPGAPSLQDAGATGGLTGSTLPPVGDGRCDPPRRPSTSAPGQGARGRAGPAPVGRSSLPPVPCSPSVGRWTSAAAVSRPTGWNGPCGLMGRRPRSAGVRPTDHRDPVRHARLLPHHPRHPLPPHPRARAPTATVDAEYRRHGWTPRRTGTGGTCAGRRGLEPQGRRVVTVTDTPTLSYTITRTISVTVDVTPDDAADARDVGGDGGSTPPLLADCTARRRRGPSSTNE